MTLTSLLNRAVTITARSWAGTVDAYGNQTATIATISTVGELQQKQRDENTVEGEISGSQWLLVLPAGTSIGPGDTVTVELQEFEVYGEPWEARNPRTHAASHVEATLIRAAGTQEAADAA